MYEQWKGNRSSNGVQMAQKFNGKWQLSKSEGHIEFYQSINTPKDDIEKNKFVDDPANDIADEFIVKDDTIEKHFYIGGQDVHTMTFKIGELRNVEYDGGHYTVLTQIEGDKLVDIINRPGLKEARYERSISGDKLRIDMVNAADGVKGFLEFTKVTNTK